MQAKLKNYKELPTTEVRLSAPIAFCLCLPGIFLFLASASP